VLSKEASDRSTFHIEDDEDKFKITYRLEQIMENAKLKK
jgi:hypothetical protein